MGFSLHHDYQLGLGRCSELRPTCVHTTILLISYRSVQPWLLKSHNPSGAACDSRATSAARCSMAAVLETHVAARLAAQLDAT